MYNNYWWETSARKNGEDVKKELFTMTIVTLIIGFMIAVQFQTIKEPEVRDTRDSWELREDLLKEKEIELKLLSEIRSTNQKLQEYQNQNSQSKEQILMETIDELKQEIGLTEATGNGITISIEPVDTTVLIGEEPPSISADLLKRLINELNRYGAKELSINDQRYINTSVIREINGETKINGYPLDKFPIKIIALAPDKESAEKLYNRMKVSKSADEFFLYNMLLNINKPQEELTIPAYDDAIRIRYMEPVKQEGGGS